VTREVKKRKEADAVVEKALQLAKDVRIPAEVLQGNLQLKLLNWD